MILSSVTLSEAKGLLIEEVEKPSSRLHPFLLCHCEAFFAEGSPYFEEVNRPSSVTLNSFQGLNVYQGRDSETSACFRKGKSTR